LLPDGTPDVVYRTACGGQKLRDIMLEGYIDLYGPYVSAAAGNFSFVDVPVVPASQILMLPLLQDKPLSNCSGGGECGTCMVEVTIIL
jgi:hypothetical protein